MGECVVQSDLIGYDSSVVVLSATFEFIYFSRWLLGFAGQSKVKQSWNVPERGRQIEAHEDMAG